MLKSGSKVIGITVGDPAGIGPEVAARALTKAFPRGRFLIIGDPATLTRYFPRHPRNSRLHPVEAGIKADWKPGCPTANSGQASLSFLNVAVDLLKAGAIAGLVTAPLAKESVCRFEPGFVGHTEYLAQAFGVKNFDMMFVTKDIKTVIVTRHIPILDVPKSLTRKKIFDTIVLTDASLKTMFRIRRPRIAVCGLNPHAGEGGLIGKEEITTIIPAIKRARDAGILVSGPLSGDTMFVPAHCRAYHAVISMYHDQGLIAMKSKFFSEVVNLTIGLPFVRTSPAHGTAFDIAGKNKADASSMAAAIRWAVELS